MNIGNHSCWCLCAEEVPEQSLLNELPLQLRGEAINCFLDSVFRGLAVFQNQRHDVLTLLASCLHPHTTLPGHNLSREGSPADRLWILQTGEASAGCSLRYDAVRCQAGWKCSRLQIRGKHNMIHGQACHSPLGF